MKNEFIPTNFEIYPLEKESPSVPTLIKASVLNSEPPSKARAEVYVHLSVIECSPDVTEGCLLKAHLPFYCCTDPMLLPPGHGHEQSVVQAGRQVLPAQGVSEL